MIIKNISYKKMMWLI